MTYWQRFDVCRTSCSCLAYWLQWSTWPRNHLVPCTVATVLGPSTRLNSISRRKHRKSKDESKKGKDFRARCKHKSMVVMPNVKGLSEVYTGILASHGSTTTANRPYWMVRNVVVQPKNKVKDEKKTELMYHVPCKNCPICRLRIPSGSLAWVLMSTKKDEWIPSQLVHRPEPPEQGRVV